MQEDIFTLLTKELEQLSTRTIEEKVLFQNRVKQLLHEHSPFHNEPVDLVQWVKKETVVANEYNPNKVAPPEMILLETSIINDGYTQPIVTWQHDSTVEVVDGFHRSRVGKESKVVSQRIHGYLPVVGIRKEQQDKNDRIASTIRHNRARGKHQVDAMSEIILELKNRNWKNERIAKELGMDEDEILRLCQVTGLAELFLDDDFSRAWDAEDSINDFEPLTDEILREEINVKTSNTSDPNRIFHTYDKWECHKAGFYASTKEGMSGEECLQAYKSFFTDIPWFKVGLENVTTKWKHSCEHYLTNSAINRIAWLGQASICYEMGIPSKFCGGFNLLSEQEKQQANEVALEYLNYWLVKNGLPEVDMNEALSLGRQINIY